LLLANDSIDKHISEALARVRDKLSEGQVSEAGVLASEYSQAYKRRDTQLTA
jgi:hypothetical protein